MENGSKKNVIFLCFRFSTILTTNLSVFGSHINESQWELRANGDITMIQAPCFRASGGLTGTGWAVDKILQLQKYNFTAKLETWNGVPKKKK